jgi:hypothetical protein
LFDFLAAPTPIPTPVPEIPEIHTSSSSAGGSNTGIIVGGKNKSIKKKKKKINLFISLIFDFSLGKFYSVFIYCFFFFFNKILVIIAVLVIIAIAGVIIFFVLRRRRSNNAETKANPIPLNQAPSAVQLTPNVSMQVRFLFHSYSKNNKLIIETTFFVNENT